MRDTHDRPVQIVRIIDGWALGIRVLPVFDWDARTGTRIDVSLGWWHIRFRFAAT